MKRILIALIAASSLTAAAAPAFAAPGQDINARQANIERRIEVGIRNGSLTRPEAMRLRGESRQIARIEHRYRANGLSGWERRDLDNRLNALSAQVADQRHDREARNDWRH
jgi:Ni/Co efflux regulator RcnB